MILLFLMSLVGRLRLGSHVFTLGKVLPLPSKKAVATPSSETWQGEWSGPAPKNLKATPTL